MERFFRRYANRLQPFYEQMPVALQNVMTTARGWVLARNRYHSKMYSLCDELLTHDSWCNQQVEAHQLERLARAAETARFSPFYANYPKLKWDALDRIRALPILG